MHVEDLEARVNAQPVEHEQDADDRDECERENPHLRMGVDEIRSKGLMNDPNYFAMTQIITLVKGTCSNQL